MLKNILYILLLERLHFDRSVTSHHPLLGSFSFGGSSGTASGQHQDRPANQYIRVNSGQNTQFIQREIFRHSDKHQATNSWQEQFQIQSPEIQGTVYVTEEKHGKEQFSDKILKVAIEKTIQLSL